MTTPAPTSTDFKPRDRWLTPVQAAEMLGISIDTLDRLRSAGKIPWARPPGSRLVRYRESQLLRLMEKCERPALPQIEGRRR